MAPHMAPMVAPSSEGWPLNLGDAAVCGKPVTTYCFAITQPIYDCVIPIAETQQVHPVRAKTLSEVREHDSDPTSWDIHAQRGTRRAAARAAPCSSPRTPSPAGASSGTVSRAAARRALPEPPASRPAHPAGDRGHHGGAVCSGCSSEDSGCKPTYSRDGPPPPACEMVPRGRARV